MAFPWRFIELPNTSQTSFMFQHLGSQLPESSGTFCQSLVLRSLAQVYLAKEVWANPQFDYNLDVGPKNGRKKMPPFSVANQKQHNHQQPSTSIHVHQIQSDPSKLYGWSRCGAPEDIVHGLFWCHILALAANHHCQLHLLTETTGKTQGFGKPTHILKRKKKEVLENPNTCWNGRLIWFWKTTSKKGSQWGNSLAIVDVDQWLRGLAVGGWTNENMHVNVSYC